jgi:hypothetical protein
VVERSGKEKFGGEEMRISISCVMGMVMIDSNLLAYSNIKDMYQNGAGHGVQVNYPMNEEEALKICAQIADLCYQLEDLHK